MKRDNQAPQAALIIDLDRDLLRGNLKAERFWSAVNRDWRAVLRGKVIPALNVSLLPLDARVEEACMAAKKSGREVILHDAGAPAVARTISTRLGTVDEVVEGPAPSPMAFSGGSAPVWREMLRQMRPHQWVKNSLIFLPMLAAHAFNSVTFFESLLAFVAFSLIASAVYVLNDLSDLNADRRHHTKCERPFASGRLPVRYGLPMLAGLLLAGFAVALFATWELVVVLGAYFILTTAYSMNLKGRLAVDIVVLALLYTVRIVAGSAATGIEPSVWLLSFSMFLFLSLASTKRLAELVGLEARPGVTAAAGRAYTVEDLPIIAMIANSAGFIAVLVLALYLDSPEVRAMYAMPMVLWGICLLLLFWVSRIVLLAHRGLVHEDPVVFALRDPVSRVVAVLSAILFLIANYA